MGERPAIQDRLYKIIHENIALLQIADIGPADIGPA